MLPTDETLHSLPTAVELATDTRPHPATLHRWRMRGIRGIHLDSVLVGGRRMTSVEAVHRFVAATTAAADGEAPKARTSRQREAAVAAAERELADAGI